MYGSKRPRRPQALGAAERRQPRAARRWKRLTRRLLLVRPCVLDALTTVPAVASAFLDVYLLLPRHARLLQELGLIPLLSRHERIEVGRVNEPLPFIDPE